MSKIISEKEYDDLIAKLLVEGLTEEEREKVDEFQKALRQGKAKKTDPTEKRDKYYKNELKRRMGYDYDKKVLNKEDPRYEALTKTPEKKLRLGSKVRADIPGEVGKIVNITQDFVKVRDKDGKLHLFDEDDLMLEESKKEGHLKKGDVVDMKGIKVKVTKVNDKGYEVEEVAESEACKKKESINPKKEKFKSKISRFKERLNPKKESITPAFQKELFRLLRNHYPNASASDMEKVSKFIDKNCSKE